MRVSVDSFDPAEIRTAVEAGAELVLSVNGSNLDVARELAGSGAARRGHPRLRRGARHPRPRASRSLERWKVRYLIDPVIEPIGFGFMASLERYAEVHRRYPEAPKLMGIGNITELTSADTTGVNALLIAICEETGVRAVLTTEVIPWARGAVREIDIARRLMHHAVTHRTLPKGVDDRLLTVKDPEDPGVRRGGAAPAPRGGEGPQLPHLHRPRHDHRVQRRAVRPRHRHPGDLRASSAWTTRPTRSTWAGS